MLTLDQLLLPRRLAEAYLMQQEARRTDEQAAAQGPPHEAVGLATWLGTARTELEATWMVPRPTTTVDGDATVSSKDVSDWTVHIIFIWDNG